MASPLFRTFEERRDAMLGEVCAKLGYCDASYRAARESNFIDVEVHGVDEIVDAIFASEGIESWAADPQHRSRISEIVSDWLFDPHGRGAQPRI